MKTIQLNEEIQRVKDDVAHEKVTRYGWKYIPRSIWKEKVRDVKKQTPAVKPVKEGKNQKKTAVASTPK